MTTGKAEFRIKMSDRKCKYLSCLVLLSVICLSSGCSTTDREVNLNTSPGVQVDAVPPGGGSLIEDQDEDDDYEFAKEYSAKQIKEYSEKVGLAPLSKKSTFNGFEFRIWTNLGCLDDPKLLVVRSSVDGQAFKDNASFFEMDRSAEPFKFRKEHLAEPKSGWNKMLFELRGRLTTPKGLVPDPQFPLERDECIILLEVLDKGEYRLVLYGQHTSFPDGKRLIEVCNYLASEFNVDMHCAGESRP
jgi:hypothetical protein